MTSFQTSRATPTNFSLIFPKLPSESTVAASEELTLHLVNTVIPSLTIPSITVNWMGIEARYDAVHHINYGDWSITYKVDADFNNWKKLYTWLKFITSTKADPALDHVIPSEHQINARLIITDNFKNNILAIELHNVWIDFLGEVSLAYDKGEMILEGSARLKYSAYEMSEI